MTAGLNAVKPQPAVGAINRLELAAESLRYVPICEMLQPENAYYFARVLGRLSDFAEMVNFVQMQPAQI